MFNLEPYGTADAVSNTLTLGWTVVGGVLVLFLTLRRPRERAAALRGQRRADRQGQRCQGRPPGPRRLQLLAARVRHGPRAPARVRAPPGRPGRLCRARIRHGEGRPRAAPAQGAGRDQGRRAGRLRVLHGHRLDDLRQGRGDRGAAAGASPALHERPLLGRREAGARPGRGDDAHARGRLRRAARAAERALRRGPARGARERDRRGELPRPLRLGLRHRLAGLHRGRLLRAPGAGAAGRSRRRRRSVRRARLPCAPVPVPVGLPACRR